MAFSFGNASTGPGTGSGMAAGGAGGLIQGPDLEVIQTEGLGFLSLAGDAKVQLTSRWSPPPAPTASLLTIASRKGLVAAAGPDAVHIATTESVRKAYEAPKSGDTEVRQFTPQAKLPLPVRISQLAFTADEQYLILSAETGGGLAVYEVQALTQGTTKPAFEIGTNGDTLRALVPNPMPELAAQIAIVTSTGNLLMANLAERTLVAGPNGPVLRSQVTCAAWSTKGKQLVAGMADGTIYQMTPDGAEKAHIPKPPSLGDYHVSSVTWLENHVFLVVHSVQNGQEPSVYHLITRQQAAGAPASFAFQKITDPVEPFGSDKAPHHTLLRLKDFPPNLQDLLLVSSTSTESIGLLSRSKAPLASDKPADSITNVFTTTELADDSRRAQLPMSEDLSETFPVGIALDLSSKEKVYKPIPTDEIEQSPGPLPGLWALNNEGVLASWWVVYNDSIRSGTTYPGLAAVDTTTTPTQSAFSNVAAPTTAFGSPASQAPAFGSPAGVAPAFGKSSLSAQPSPWPTRSAASATPAFGSSPFGSKPAATTPATPAFGSSTFGSKPAAPAFGQSTSIGGLGAKPSLWATASPSAVTQAFGQVGFASVGPSPGKVFGSSVVGSTPSASGGFAGFASKGGFGTIGGSSAGSSVFGSKPAAGTFGTPDKPAAAFGTPEVSMDADTAFPPPSAKPQGTSFGSSPFVLGTTFKADPKTADEAEKPSENKGSSLFGGFGLSLGDAAKEPAAVDSKDQDMESTAPTPVQEKPKSIFDLGSTTPTTTPAPKKYDFKDTSGTPAGSGGLFSIKPTGFPGLFGTPKIAPTEDSKLKPVSLLFGTPKIKKEEEDSNKENLASIPQAPLPPDTTTSDTPAKGTGASPPLDSLSKTPAVKKEESPSLSDKESKSAPLPPDFLPSKPKESKAAVSDDAPLPPDFIHKPFSQQLPALPAVPGSPPPGSPPPGSPPGSPPSSAEEGEASENGEFSDEDHDEDYDQDQEEGSEEDEEDGEGEDRTEAISEGSGIDVQNDFSQTTNVFGTHTPGITPQSSFGGLGGSTFSTISRSETNPPRPLFGEISRNAPPIFPPPAPHSPRSPSPIRSALRTNLLRTGDGFRSVSAPGVASNLLGRSAPQPQQNLRFTINQPPPVDPNVENQRKLAAKREAEERVLNDPEDEGIRQILHSEIKPTLVIDEFLAVDRKMEAGDTSQREQVPVACENLWRDINRMVDRLGLNSRSLQSFILGHTEEYKESGRHKEDLERPDEWVLVEAEDLGIVIENELGQDLEDGRVKDIEASEAAIQSLSRDLVKLRAKEEDMRKILMSHIDPDQVAVAKSIPLSAEQATQQNELRRAYATFSKLLAETEEALTMLKAKISSAGGGSGKTPVPTVEAIIRTINKMTTMAEKRSGDVDVLENQMRRLRFGSMGLGGSPAPRSREGSPFNTPQRRSMMSPERMRDSIVSSSGGARGTPTRKKVSMYTEEEKKTVRQKDARRKNMLQLLRTSLERSGPNVSRLRDDD